MIYCNKGVVSLLLVCGCYCLKLVFRCIFCNMCARACEVFGVVVDKMVIPIYEGLSSFYQQSSESVNSVTFWTFSHYYDIFNHCKTNKQTNK